MTSRLLIWLAVLVAPAVAPPRRRAQAPKSKHKPHTLEHFAEFCRRFIVLDNGKPFELESFQRLILKGFFAGVTELLVLLPKKNGKTTLLAALALYHLIYTPDAKCYIAASAKDQAKVLYDQACGFVERKDPTGKLLPQAAALQKRVLLRKATKEIRSRRDSGFIWVVSGDKDTVDGVIVTLGLVDELHRHKDNGQLYGVLADGVGPRNGQIVTISTAGERLKSALGRIRAKAYKFGVKRLKQFGRCNFARSPNGKFEMYEWTLDEDDARDDLAIVKLANPLESNTIESLRQRKESPTMTASRWARFGCGIWMHGGDAAISSIDVGRCVRKGLEQLPPTSAIYIGLDIGWRWDTTAVVPGMPHDREEFEVEDEKTGRTIRFWRYRKVRFGKPKILIPPRDGTSLPHGDVIGAVLHFKNQGYEILGVVFDRNAEGEKVAQELENEHGLEVIEHSQAANTMADASMGLATAIGTVDEDGDRLVELPEDDEFIAHLLAAKARTTSGEKWRFDAPTENRGQRKHGQQDHDDVEVIDAAIAAAMLHHTATAPVEIPPDRSAYRMEFA